MNLNTNFSNQNNQKGISFQATFRTEIPVKNIERLANIKRIFAEKTQHYSTDKDFLVLSKSKDPSFEDYNILRTTDEISCGEYQYSHLAPDLDELMATMSDNQIAKKLVSFFKIMKKESQLDIVMAKFLEQIEHLKSKRLQNLTIAKAASKSGNETTASTFRALAESNQKKLQSIEAEAIKTKEKLINDMRKIEKDQPELEHISDIYTEFTQIK